MLVAAYHYSYLKKLHVQGYPFLFCTNLLTKLNFLSFVGETDTSKVRQKPSQFSLLLKFLYHSLVICSLMSLLCSLCGKRDGLLVSAVDAGLGGLGSSPGQIITLCSREEDALISLLVSSPRYINGYCRKQRVTLSWISNPSRGRVTTEIPEGINF